MKKFWIGIFKFFLYLFALIGVTFTAVYFGMRLGLFNVRGSIAGRNQFFTGTSNTAESTKTLTLTQTCTDSQPVCNWNETPEWAAIKGGLQKDAAIITKVAGETGVSARMIASVVVPEQTRFFTANREIFKSYFEPLKLLGSMTQFSLGVSGVKQETANDIEKNALDASSVFYPGSGYANLFAYTDDTKHDSTLYKRLTDEKDHYYQYLYTALYIKEIESQWGRQGFDITQKPEVVVTLFNLGFLKSKPNASPIEGGAPILTGGKIYTYGELGSTFYGSNELTDVFPR